MLRSSPPRSCSAGRATQHSLTADPPLKSGLGPGQSDGGGGGLTPDLSLLHWTGGRARGKIAGLVTRDGRQC